MGNLAESMLMPISEVSAIEKHMDGVGADLHSVNTPLALAALNASSGLQAELSKNISLAQIERRKGKNSIDCTRLLMTNSITFMIKDNGLRTVKLHLGQMMTRLRKDQSSTGAPEKHPLIVIQSNHS